MMSERVNPKRLFDDVTEGDQILFADRDEPVTAYRHVTEDDHAGQVITMKRVTEDMAEQAAWEAENGYRENDAIRAGDLITMDLTGDEFLIARGPRGGCYLLKQWWSKNAGNWTASIALYRRTRAGNEVWTWENTVDVEIVGATDVDRDAFDEGGDWTRHTEVAGATVWTNTLEGEVWAHTEDLTGSEPRTPADTGEDPVDVLEAVSEGDTVQVNELDARTVTGVTDEYSGVLADGVSLTLDTGDEELKVRTFADKGYAAVMGADISEDVDSVTVGDAVEGEPEDGGDDDDDPEVMTDGGVDVAADGGELKAYNVHPGQVYRTLLGGRVEVIADDGPSGKPLKVRFPEREGGRQVQFMSRYSFADAANYEGYELATEDGPVEGGDDEDAPADLPGEWLETPRCPICGAFMSRDMDGLGLPAAQCAKTGCYGMMDDRELIDCGYFLEGGR